VTVFDIPTVQAAFTIRQGVDDEPNWSNVGKAVQEIAAVQIDTISVVARSHHLTLRNRVKNYHPDQLWIALRNRDIFEHFAHSCCYVPIEEYPFYWHRMNRFPLICGSWYKKLLNEHNRLMDSVEARIRNEGALSSRDFEDPSGKKRSGFWDLKPAKIALDLLWQTGRLAITDRQGFQIIYDLPEHVIPSKYLNQQIEEERVWRHFMERNLDCLVIASAKDLVEYITFSNLALETKGNRTKTIESKLRILEGEDVVMQVEAANLKQPHYMLTKNQSFIHRIHDRRYSSTRVWFLNPFDNIVWNRNRVQRLFGVEVKLEAYTPKAQRRFGYYVTPILWKHRIIGRIDPKADRAKSSLILHNVEVNLPRNELSDAIEPINQELERYKEFHGLETIQINNTKPAKLKSQLHA